MKLNVSRFKESAVAFNTWSVVPEYGTSFEAVLQPEFWSHVGERLRPGDLIQVRPEEMNYFAELLVISAGRLFANVQVLRHVEIDANAAEAEVAEYDVVWRGPHRKFGVLRLRDKEVVKDEFATKDDARTWIASHRNAMAA